MKNFYCSLIVFLSVIFSTLGMQPEDSCRLPKQSIRSVVLTGSPPELNKSDRPQLVNELITALKTNSTQDVLNLLKDGAGIAKNNGFTALGLLIKQANIGWQVSGDDTKEDRLQQLMILFNALRTLAQKEDIAPILTTAADNHKNSPLAFALENNWPKAAINIVAIAADAPNDVLKKIFENQSGVAQRTPLSQIIAIAAQPGSHFDSTSNEVSSRAYDLASLFLNEANNYDRFNRGARLTRYLLETPDKYGDIPLQTLLKSPKSNNYLIKLINLLYLIGKIVSSNQLNNYDRSGTSTRSMLRARGLKITPEEIIIESIQE